MGKFRGNLFTKILAFLSAIVLLVTGMQFPAMADEVGLDGAPLLGHYKDEGTIIQTPTCSTEGLIQYHCFQCGMDMGTETIPATGQHVRDGGNVVQAATCSSDGVIAYHCQFCGCDMGTETIPATGQHVRDGGNVVQAATCTDNGVIAYHCVACGCDMGTDAIPAPGHQSDAGTIVKKPTATEPGKIEYKCTVCGTVIKEEPIPVIAKRDLPQAVFDTASCNLTNVPENSTVKINGAVITNNASGTASLFGRFPQTGDYTITVIANDIGTQAESDPQSIHTHKPKAPSHIQVTPEPASGGTGYIGGVDTSMEYTLQDSDSWFACTTSSQPVSAGIYIVRYKATANSIASDSVEALVKKEGSNKPATPTAAFSGATHQLTGLVAGMVYSTNGGDTWTKVSTTAITLSEDAINQAVSYKMILVKNIVEGVESDIQNVAIGRNVQPTGLVTTPATAGNNGTISGTSPDMQFVKEGSGTWIDIGSNTISGLSKGKYYIRRKATGAIVESHATEVFVDDKYNGSKEATPNASFNAYNMHIDHVSGCRISFDGGNNWTNTIPDATYVANEGVVKASSGIIIYRPGNGYSTTDSDRQYIVVTKQPTPTGITATSATPTIPGTIVGTDSSMQYRLENQPYWVDITTNKVAVAAGTYYLRRHGYGNALPSDWLTIVIKATADVTPTKPTNVIPVDNDTKKEEAKTEDIKKKDAEKKENAAKEEKAEEKVKETVKEEVLEEEKELNGIEVVTEEAVKFSLENDGEWESIESEFANVSVPVIVELNSNTRVPSEVFTKAAETSTPLVFAVNNDAAWSIASTDINTADVTALGAVNLGIQKESTTIPKVILSSVEDESANQKVVQTFDILHNGNFGFKAKLTLKVDSARPGEYATLFYYDAYKGSMEYIDSSLVNDKNEATFTMTHASSYAVVTSPEALSQGAVKEVKVESVSKADETTNEATSAAPAAKEGTQKKSPVVAVLVIIIVVVALGLAVLLVMQGKKKKIHK